VRRPVPGAVHARDWGYPIIDKTPIPADVEDHARRAVAACPTLALVLKQEAQTRA